MNETVQKANFGRRLAAFLLDFIILCLVLAIGFLICFIFFRDSSLFTRRNFIFAALALYCLKDIFGGISIGKWALGLAVRRRNDPDTQPAPWHLLLRNISILLWPLELIVLAASKDKRKISDKLAGTDVYCVSRRVKLGVIIPVSIVGGIMLFSAFIFSLIFGITGMIRNHDSFQTAIAYIEASEEIQEIVGEITGYGFFVNGGFHIANGFGEAEYIIHVIGEDGDLRVAVRLERNPREPWELIEIQH